MGGCIVGGEGQLRRREKEAAVGVKDRGQREVWTRTAAVPWVTWATLGFLVRLSWML